MDNAYDDEVDEDDDEDAIDDDQDTDEDIQGTAEPNFGPTPSKKGENGYHQPGVSADQGSKGLGAHVKLRKDI